MADNPFDDLESYINGFPTRFKQEMLKLLEEIKKTSKPRRPLPTLERVKELLDYQSISGELVWKKPRTKNMVAGTRAGSINIDGYRVIVIDGTEIKAHRLVWFYNTGVWPRNGMDHINGQKIDNRLENLRDSTASVSSFNRGRPRNNTSGIVGVSWHKRYKKWEARIGVGGKVKCLGHFTNIRDAQAARLKAERKYFPGVKRWAA